MFLSYIDTKIVNMTYLIIFMKSCCSFFWATQHVILFIFIKGESHIDFRAQCVIMTLTGGGVGSGGGEGGVAITNDVLKFKKIIEFENLKVHVLQFASLKFIWSSMEKDHLSIKKVVRKLRIKSYDILSNIKNLGTCFIWCQLVPCWSPYVQVHSVNYSPFSSL